jgi:transposase
VALEAGTHSPWVSELISASGHEAVVLDARKNRLIAESYGKNDGVDAATLAWLQRGVDAHLLKRVHHRGTKARQDRAVLKARDALVAARTKLINAARGLVKSNGERLPKCSAESFATKAAGAVPKELEPALLPLIAEVGALTQRLRTMAREIERLCQQDYPETALLQQVNGVGSVTSLTYVLTLERAERLRHHRDAGPWLGLVRKRRKSAQTDPQLRITKCGDRMLRRLMITSAQYVLGPFGADCDLRRFGQRLLAGGGKQAKKRAVVAVARKLAVLLHLLWQTAAVYEPFYQKLAAAPVNAA